MEYEEDYLLWENLRTGDRKSLDTIFLKYHDALITFAKTYVNADDAEEVVADIFFLLWSKKHQIDIKISLKAYLYKVTTNRCLNVIRQSKNKDKIIETLTCSIQSANSQPDDMLIYQQTKIQLDRLINSLPEQCKTIFLLSRYDGLSYLEISKILNISINTVNTHMYRALKFLKSKSSSYLDYTFVH